MKIANCFSAALTILCVIHQVSVLGPLVFYLYTTPLNSVIQTHNLDHHLYDTLIYLSLVTPESNCSLNQRRDCLQNVFHGTTNSELKLNANKPEFLIIGTQKQRGILDCFFPTPMLSQNFTPAVSARNLGVNFDNN